jgi:hypothetical protein
VTTAAAAATAAAASAATAAAASAAAAAESALVMADSIVGSTWTKNKRELFLLKMKKKAKKETPIT